MEEAVDFLISAIENVMIVEREKLRVKAGLGLSLVPFNSCLLSTSASHLEFSHCWMTLRVPSEAWQTLTSCNPKVKDAVKMTYESCRQIALPSWSLTADPTNVTGTCVDLWFLLFGECTTSCNVEHVISE